MHETAGAAPSRLLRMGFPPPLRPSLKVFPFPSLPSNHPAQNYLGAKSTSKVVVVLCRTITSLSILPTKPLAMPVRPQDGFKHCGEARIQSLDTAPRVSSSSSTKVPSSSHARTHTRCDCTVGCNNHKSSAKTSPLCFSSFILKTNKKQANSGRKLETQSFFQVGGWLCQCEMSKSEFESESESEYSLEAAHGRSEVCLCVPF
jgi:hypothetical protein